MQSLEDAGITSFLIARHDDIQVAGPTEDWLGSSRFGVEQTRPLRLLPLTLQVVARPENVGR